ncbi:unnamed protein product [Staurois parvus]|uniref:Uncharacterized protein n=1 Tax=Staurois parvus TaxID=386267 RepID=A0ABN9B9F8_9NEOB|nr:unnamed protein product [Staurois parvus]
MILYCLGPHELSVSHWLPESITLIFRPCPYHIEIYR